MFRLALNYVTTLIRLRNDCAIGDAPLPYLLTRGQAPSTNAAPEENTSFQIVLRKRRTKFSKVLISFGAPISPIGDGADIGVIDAGYAAGQENQLQLRVFGIDCD